MGRTTRIEWCDATINPVIGCSRGCDYCYARRLNDRFGWVEDFSRPQWFPRALEKPGRWRKPKRIFVCSMGELFDSRVPKAWRHRVFAMMAENPRHRFLLLTRCAELAATWVPLLPENAGIGVTMTSNRDRSNSLDYYIEGSWRAEERGFVSFEPLLGPVDEISFILFPWVIIGAQTGPGGRQPRREWVQDILDRAEERGLPVFMKDNLEWEGERRQEWPEWLRLPGEE